MNERAHLIATVMAGNKVIRSAQKRCRQQLVRWIFTEPMAVQFHSYFSCHRASKRSFFRGSGNYCIVNYKRVSVTRRHGSAMARPISGGRHSLGDKQANEWYSGAGQPGGQAGSYRGRPPSRRMPS